MPFEFATIPKETALTTAISNISISSETSSISSNSTSATSISSTTSNTRAPCSDKLEAARREYEELHWQAGPAIDILEMKIRELVLDANCIEECILKMVADEANDPEEKEILLEAENREECLDMMGKQVGALGATGGLKVMGRMMDTLSTMRVAVQKMERIFDKKKLA